MITLTAKIYISDTEIIEIDRRNMLGIDCSIFDRSDLKLPSFGIISNVGNIEFNDNDGRVLQYAESLQLQAGQKCEIWLNNTLVEGASDRIGLFETDQWEYDNDNRVVSVSLKDDLEEWQEITITEIPYSPTKSKHQPFSWFYKELYKKTPKKYNMLPFDSLDESTKEALNSKYIANPMLKSSSLWSAWEKFCVATMTHIYKNFNGEVVCRGGWGI